MKGISLVERVSTTPLGLDFAGAFVYQEVRETHDSHISCTHSRYIQ